MFFVGKMNALAVMVFLFGLGLMSDGKFGIDMTRYHKYYIEMGLLGLSCVTLFMEGKDMSEYFSDKKFRQILNVLIVLLSLFVIVVLVV